jgi:hypothetical protein
MNEKATARTLADWEINQYAVFLPYAPATGDDDTEALPGVVLAGDEDGQGGVQVYAYAQDGAVVISLHFDTAGPDEDGRGPWAYYGPEQNRIPVVIDTGGNQPVYVAREGVPDLSPELVQDALAALGTHSLGVRKGRMGDRVSGGDRCAELLARFLDITGRATEDDQEPQPAAELPIWNTVVRVIARVTAVSGPKAIAYLADALIRAGFDPIDGPGYCEAKDLRSRAWQVTQTVVANRRAPYGARAHRELADALNKAGFLTAASPVQRGDWFAAEDGTQVTELPDDPRPPVADQD